MKARLCAAAAVVAIACTSPALAQPSNDPNAPFQFDEQVIPPYGAPLREAAEQLKARFDEQHRLNPNLPDFDEAVVEAVLAREDELVQVLIDNIVMLIDKMPPGPTRDNMQALTRGRDFNSLTRSEQEAVVGGTLTFSFAMARADNRIMEGIVQWFGNVLDRMAVQLPEGDPARQSARRLIDSAQMRATYTHGQEEMEIDRGEGIIQARTGEITDALSEEARRNPDMFRGGGQRGSWVIHGANGEVYINDRGEIGASVRLPDTNGEMNFELREFRTARPGVITTAERNRIVDYIRANFPYNSRDMVVQLDTFIRRVNSAQRRAGAGGAGGAGRGGAAGGFLPTVWDDFLDNGGGLTTVQLEQIYRGYDPDNPVAMARSRAGIPNPARPASEGRSLVSTTPSLAPTSPSAVGTSPSLAGTDYRDWAMQEINDALYGLTSRRGGRTRWAADDLNLDLLSWGGGNRVSVTPSPRDGMTGYQRPDDLAEITTPATPFNRSIEGEFGGSTGGFEDVVISGALAFDLFDFAVEDGDIVALNVSSSGRTVVSDTVTLTNAGRSFSASAASGLTIITITAQNTGQLPPNTGAITVTSPVVSGSGAQTYSLDTGQTGALRVLVLGRRARTR